MDSGTLIALALSLAGQALSDAKVNGAAAEIIAELESAVASLVKVHGSDVTFAQLEGLRTKPLW
jgi:hypothetical protein